MHICDRNCLRPGYNHYMNIRSFSLSEVCYSSDKVNYHLVEYRQVDITQYYNIMTVCMHTRGIDICFLFTRSPASFKKIQSVDFCIRFLCGTLLECVRR